MYTLAEPTFIISLLLDRLGVTKVRFVCCLAPPAVSASVSDYWFGKAVLCVFLTDFQKFLCFVYVVFF